MTSYEARLWFDKTVQYSFSWVVFQNLIPFVVLNCSFSSTTLYRFIFINPGWSQCSPDSSSHTMNLSVFPVGTAVLIISSFGMNAFTPGITGGSIRTTSGTENEFTNSSSSWIVLRFVTYLLFFFVYQSHWFVLTYLLYSFRRFDAYIATPIFTPSSYMFHSFVVMFLLDVPLVSLLSLTSVYADRYPYLLRTQHRLLLCFT